jgi:hypothetical protein
LLYHGKEFGTLWEAELEDDWLVYLVEEISRE